ncbi:MAG: NADPH-dependent F420 reductase [Acidimicrobiales bacterium]
MTVQTVAILGGTGPQGRGIALRLARAGVPVVIGSRDGARAADAAAELGGGPALLLRGAGNAEAAQAATIVFVAVPWPAHHDTLAGLRAELAGKIVVDVVNPLEFDAQGPVALPVAEGSAAQQAQALLPDSVVVAGFHHVSAKTLLDETRGIDEDVMICGDDDAAKLAVIALADLLPGVRGIDAGPLRLSGLTEGLTAVLLSINRRYRTTTGLRLTDLDPARRRPA